jgi:hypothetical protein
MFSLDSSETHKLTCDERGRVDKSRLADRLGEISREFGKPVVFKNPICGFQASLLEECYPKSFFVFVDRNDLELLASIKKVRVDRFGSPDVWWSLKPSTYSQISRITPADEQIAAQIRDCRREFQVEFSSLSRQVIDVDYSDVRKDPLRVLIDLSAGLEKMGCSTRLLKESELLLSPSNVGLY